MEQLADTLGPVVSVVGDQPIQNERDSVVKGFDCQRDPDGGRGLGLARDLAGDDVVVFSESRERERFGLDDVGKEKSDVDVGQGEHVVVS